MDREFNMMIRLVSLVTVAILLGVISDRSSSCRQAETTGTQPNRCIEQCLALSARDDPAVWQTVVTQCLDVCAAVYNVEQDASKYGKRTKSSTQTWQIK